MVATHDLVQFVTIGALKPDDALFDRMSEGHLVLVLRGIVGRLGE